MSRAIQSEWDGKMKEEITCPICHEIFVDPKQLPDCLHTFCSGCIVGILNRSTVCASECPLCRTPVQHSDNIKSDFHMKAFVRLYHERMSRQESEATIQEINEHRNPSMDEIEDSIFFADKVAGRARKELQQLVEPLHSRHNHVLSVLDKLEGTKQKFQSKHDADYAQVKEFFSQLRSTLDTQEENSLHKLNEILASSLKTLSQQTHDLSDLETQLDSCEATLLTLMQSKNHARVVEMESRVKQGAKELIKTVNLSSQLEPLCLPSTTVLYADQEKFATDCNSLCQVYCGTAYAPNCSILYVTDHMISVTKPIMVTVALRDVHNNPIINQSDQFDLHADQGKDFIDSKLVNEANSGIYDITYYPKVRFAHKLEIYHNNSLVANVNVPLLAVCDFTMTEQKLVETYGPDKRKFSRPCGLALGQNEEIVVSDRGLHQLIVFDANQQFRHVIGHKGHGNGEFDWPSGIVVDKMGFIYVADRKNHCVQKVRLDDGKFITKIGKKGTGNGEFNEPRAVALTRKDCLFVADSLNHRIQMFQNEKFIFCFGRYGSGPCEFDLPSSIAFNETEDKILISDNHNHRVQLYTIHGEYLNLFGDFTDVPNGLSYPQSIHRSKDGHIFISSSGNATIFIFKEDGSFVGAIKGTIDRPSELATNSRGQLISTNHKGIVISDCSAAVSPCI